LKLSVQQLTIFITQTFCQITEIVEMQFSCKAFQFFLVWAEIHQLSLIQNFQRKYSKKISLWISALFVLNCLEFVSLLTLFIFLCACVRACVRACVLACFHVYMCVCVCSCLSACVHGSVGVYIHDYYLDVFSFCKLVFFLVLFQ
jgi:hypothetical protein